MVTGWQKIVMAADWILAAAGNYLPNMFFYFSRDRTAILHYEKSLPFIFHACQFAIICPEHPIQA